MPLNGDILKHYEFNNLKNKSKRNKQTIEVEGNAQSFFPVAIYTALRLFPQSAQTNSCPGWLQVGCPASPVPTFQLSLPRGQSPDSVNCHFPPCSDSALWAHVQVCTRRP